MREKGFWSEFKLLAPINNWTFIPAPSFAVGIPWDLWEHGMTGYWQVPANRSCNGPGLLVIGHHHWSLPLVDFFDLEDLGACTTVQFFTAYPSIFGCHSTADYLLHTSGWSESEVWLCVQSGPVFFSSVACFLQQRKKQPNGQCNWMTTLNSWETLITCFKFINQNMKNTPWHLLAELLIEVQGRHFSALWICSEV